MSVKPAEQTIELGINPVNVSGAAGACCVCGSREHRRVWEARLPERFDPQDFSYAGGGKRYHGRIVECCACTHRFVSPIPVQADALYQSVVDPFYVDTEDQRRRTLREFLEFKERWAPNRGTLLDIGCYTGILLEEASKLGYRAEGIELSHWAAGLAQARGHRVRLCRLQDLRGDPATYDNISATDVLEHLENPREAAEIIRSKLNPGGCFFAVVPDFGSWHTRILGQHHWLVMLMHYHYFRKHTLLRMLQSAGFDRVEILRSPAYRLPVKDARTWAKGTPLGPVVDRLAANPAIGRVELRLRAGLFAMCFRD